MKIRKQAKDDILWYLSQRNTFKFDGNSNYINKKGINIIQYDKECRILGWY